jgi:hypothetical protein
LSRLNYLYGSLPGNLSAETSSIPIAETASVFSWAGLVRSDKGQHRTINRVYNLLGGARVPSIPVPSQKTSKVFGAMLNKVFEGC